MSKNIPKEYIKYRLTTLKRLCLSCPRNNCKECHINRKIKRFELMYEPEVWCMYCGEYGKMSLIDDPEDPNYHGSYYYCSNCDGKIQIK